MLDYRGLPVCAFKGYFNCTKISYFTKISIAYFAIGAVKAVHEIKYYIWDSPSLVVLPACVCSVQLFKKKNEYNFFENPKLKIEGLP